MSTAGSGPYTLHYPPSCFMCRYRCLVCQHAGCQGVIDIATIMMLLIIIIMVMLMLLMLMLSPSLSVSGCAGLYSSPSPEGFGVGLTEPLCVSAFR